MNTVTAWRDFRVCWELAEKFVNEFRLSISVVNIKEKIAIRDDEANFICAAEFAKCCPFHVNETDFVPVLRTIMIDSGSLPPSVLLL